MELVVKQVLTRAPLASATECESRAQDVIGTNTEHRLDYYGAESQAREVRLQCTPLVDRVCCFCERIRLPSVPILAEQLGRMRRTHGTVTAGHSIGGTILIAAPTDALWVGWMQRKFLGHAKAKIRGRCLIALIRVKTRMADRLMRWLRARRHQSQHFFQPTASSLIG